MINQDRHQGTESETIGTLGAQRDIIFLCIEEPELEGLLERALASWRMPKWEWAAIGIGVFFPTVLAILTLGNDPLRLMEIAYFSFLFTVFFIGIVIGRILRPSPSKDDVQKFADHMRFKRRCGVYVNESRQLAEQLGPIPDNVSIGDINVSNDHARFSVVDHAAMLKIQRGVETLIATNTEDARHPSVVLLLKDGRREFYSSSLECNRCHKSLKPLETKSGCSGCGKPFCDECANGIATGKIDYECDCGLRTASSLHRVQAPGNSSSA